MLHRGVHPSATRWPVVPVCVLVRRQRCRATVAGTAPARDGFRRCVAENLTAGKSHCAYDWGVIGVQFHAAGQGLGEHECGGGLEFAAQRVARARAGQKASVAV